MPTGRERVLDAVEFRETDRIPRDLGGMRSTGISAFAYPRLVEFLGLPPRRPRLYDTNQMLALPDGDVLEALGCDVVHVTMDECTNAFNEPERWYSYGFNGRLEAMVSDPGKFSVAADGTILQDMGDGVPRVMPPSSVVFDAPHGGEPLDLTGEIPRRDLKAMELRLAEGVISEERVDAIAAYLRRVREATDRAVFFNGIGLGLGFPGGMAAWSMLCLTDPDHVRGVHELVTEYKLRSYRRLLPAIGEYIDVYMLNADDQGTQNATILPPRVFRELYVPYYRRANEEFHRTAPNVKTFLHSCGAIYEILDEIVESGFDILNPVQWSAGGHSFREWKERCRGRIALWGGGANTQSTLPLGTVDQVEEEVRQVCAELADGGGFVFCAIHNILAEIAAEKVVAMYRTAGEI